MAGGRPSKAVLITRNEYLCMDEMYCEWYKCSRCDNIHIAEGFKYCPDCGVKVDFDLK